VRKLLVILSALVLGGCSFDDVVGDVSYFYDKARCDLRVGILAEMHLAPPHSDASFLRALKYFGEREVDVVVLIGDLTEDGNLVQRRGARKVWDKSFPDGRRWDGKPVEMIVVTGERDTELVHETMTGKPPEPAFSYEVKGYTFIGAHWKERMGVDAWALKPLLAKVGKEKPFFYVQNLVPYGTCCPYEGRVTDYDGGKVSYMLSKFPNAVAICARSHTPLTDETAFWRGEFTCVNAGSFAYARLRGENGETDKEAHQGLVMSVYGSTVVFERIQVGKKGIEKLGPDWKVDVSNASERRPEMSAPEFWEDTRLMVFPSAKTVSVRFPPVLAKHTGVRAYAYEVKVEGQGQETMVKTIHSSAWSQNEDHENKPVTCDFARSELPKGEVKFEVTPIDAFGKRGHPISGETQL